MRMGYDKNYNIVCPHMDFTKIGRNKIERSMTDKVQKIREEVEKLIYGFNLEADIASCEDAEAEKFADIKYQLCKKILDYIDEVQKEPVSEKKCIFTKDNYTDEDRKVLCEDCKEKCEYSKKEEPVSKELEEAASKYAHSITCSVAGSNIRLRGCNVIGRGFKAGAEWQFEQFEKNRLAACDKQTEEEAEIERDFVIGIIEKEHSQPTFDDAIKYGMRLQKEQIKEALLSEILPYFMHGGEADEVVAKLDEVLNQKK